MEHTIIGVYDSYSDAARAMNELIAAGFSRNVMHLTPEAQSEAPRQTPGQTIDGDQMSYRGILSLFGMDAHKEHLDIYAESVRRGSYVLAINIEGDAQLHVVTDTMARYNAIDIDERSSQWKKHGWAGYDTDASGASDAEVEQERDPYTQAQLTGTAAAASEPMTQKDRATDQTQMQYNGVRVYRRTNTTQSQFHDGGNDLMHSSLDTAAAGSNASHSEDDLDFRQHWQAAYSQSGRHYEDYDSAYRYGYTMAGSDRYQNYQWADVEPDLRSDWESSHPGSAWDQVKDAVRYGAERMTSRRRS